MNDDFSIGKRKKDLIKPKGKPGRPKLNPKDLVNLNEIIICECGMNIKRGNKSQHKKCKKHKLLMNTLTDTYNNQINLLEVEVKKMSVELDKLQMKLNDQKFKLKLEYYNN